MEKLTDCHRGIGKWLHLPRGLIICFCVKLEFSLDFFFYSLYSFNQYGWGINCDSHHMNTMTAPVNSIQASTSRPCLRIISFLIVRIINYYSSN